MPSSRRRVPVSIRLPPDVCWMLDNLSDKTGWDRTAVIESAIKDSWYLAKALVMKESEAQ